MKYIKSLFCTLFLMLIPLSASAETNLIEPELNWQVNQQFFDIDSIGSIKINSKFTYLNSEDTKKLNEFLGNSLTENNIVGSIFPNENTSDWQLIVAYHPVGNINTENKLNEKSILNAYTKNNKKLDNGISNIKWVESPDYNASTQTLEQTISFEDDNTLIYNKQYFKLTKSGYISFLFIFPSSEYKTIEKTSNELISNLTVNKAEQFVPNSDSKPSVNLENVSLNGISDKHAFILFLIQHKFEVFAGLIFLSVVLFNFIRNHKKESK